MTDVAVGIPSMTGPATHAALEAIGRAWTGAGVAVECGSWLGASTCALLRGLVAAGYDRAFYAFDRWTARPSEVRKARAAGLSVEVGADLLPLWQANVAAQYWDLRPQRGKIQHLRWCGLPVEVLVMDAAKLEPKFSLAMGQFLPHLVDGAWVALLDYSYWREFEGAERRAYRCQERWMAAHAERFRLEAMIPDACGAVFRYRQEGQDE